MILFPLFNLTAEASHLWLLRSSNINISPGFLLLPLVWLCFWWERWKQYKSLSLWGSLWWIVLKAEAFGSTEWDAGVKPNNQLSPLFVQSSDPILFFVVFVAFILGSKHPDARAFLSGNNYGHPCLFPPSFHFMKPQSMCHCVCSEGPDIHFGGLGHCLHWWLE